MSQLRSNYVSTKLVSELFAQKKAEKYCDLILELGDVQLKVHACVLAAFSPVVDEFLVSGEVTISPVTSMKYAVPLNCARFSCVECAVKVIDFLYIGKIKIDNEHLDHIQSVSFGLQVSELITICQKTLGKCSVPENDGSEGVNNKAYGCTSVTLSETFDRFPQQPPSQVVINTSATYEQRTDALLRISTTSNDDPLDESEWNGMKCPSCHLVLMSTAKYQQHCSIHLGKTYTTCYVCNFASIRVCDVIKHLQESNHGETVCSICLLQLGSNQSFKEHLQIHDQSQPFFCLTCNTRFQTRTALNSHIVRHTNETPFVCKECGRGFKWKHGLRSHMVTHSKLKSFLCDECGFSTAHLRSFIDHKTIHTGEKFKCPKPDCQFSSVRKESVKHHLLTHSKQKPYQCEVCGQAFSQAKNLRRHASLHNPSADPEKCPFCSFQTTRSDKFKAHFRRCRKDTYENESTHTKMKIPVNCLNAIPENLRETAKPEVCSSQCHLKGSDGNQSCFLREDCVKGINEKKMEKPKNLTTMDSFHVKKIVNRKARVSPKTYRAARSDEIGFTRAQEKSLCVCNNGDQRFFESTMHDNGFCIGDTSSGKDIDVSPSRGCSHFGKGQVTKVCTAKSPILKNSSSTAEQQPSNSLSSILFNNVIETEEILSGEDSGPLNRKFSCVRSEEESASNVDHVGPLQVCVLTEDADKIDDSLTCPLSCSHSVRESHQRHVHENKIVGPVGANTLENLEIFSLANDNFIVLNVDESFLSPPSDAVFVVPDGTFIIMDTDDIPLGSESQQNSDQIVA